MFKEAFVSGLLALTLACTSVMAQTEAPPAPPGAAEQAPPPGARGESMAPSAPMGAPPMRAFSRRAANRALIMSCRSRAIAHGLVGHQRRLAVLSCVRAKRPLLAARMVCRQKGKRLGLYPHSARLHAYVRRCLGRAG
ncbi:MAG: hypothetical protein ACLQE9_12890 [Roseiarcus sp.]